ncbi:MAG TPA: ATP-binding protein [Pseudolabrys sp.]|jgi:PAS domain S-box-containing protein|nr:ATP-binding protein [Pseudolabrys sp.]
MTSETPTRRRTGSTALAILAAVIAAGVFMLDTIAPPDVAVAVLYIAIVLIAARFLQWRGVLLVALACAGLAIISHTVSATEPASTVALINLVIGLAAIGISAYLAVLNQGAEMTARAQARLLDVAHDAIFVRDLDEDLTYWNTGAEERYGWTREQALGKNSHQLLHTIFPAPLDAIKEELLNTGRWEGELIHTRRDGTKVVVASRWSLQTDERGRPLATLETNNDITEHKRASAELQASEQKYRNIFQAVGVSIWEEDFSEVKAAIDALKAEGVNDFGRYLAEHPEFVRQTVAMVKILDVNDATVEMFGARTKDDLFVPLNRVFLPETEAVFAQILIALAEGRTSFAAETAVQSLKGSQVEILFTITFPPEPATMDSVLVSVVDITERKRSQEALDRAQAELAHVNRISTLGELTASIAHEVTQPIAATVVNAEAASRWLAASPPNFARAQRALDAIVYDGKRAGEILSRIRSLVRKTPVKREQIDINQVIAEVVGLTQGEVQRNGVTLRTQLQPELPLVLADRTQLQQVVLNFILNAVEATSGVDERRRNVMISAAQDSSNIIVAVRDTGIGLDEGDGDHLFQPFYTTKASGMGMGLSICRSIIEAHGGRVWAARNTDTGATFQFVLPTQHTQEP